jgi:hypothetical protein
MKDTVKRTRREAIDWEKYLQKIKKCLPPKIHKEPLKLNKNIKNNLIKNTQMMLHTMNHQGSTN